MQMTNLEKMDVSIVSEKFNPGHVSHLIATYRLTREYGRESTLLVHPDFEPLLRDEDVRVIYAPTLSDLVRVRDTMIVLFPSLRALFDIISVASR